MALVVMCIDGIRRWDPERPADVDNLVSMTFNVLMLYVDGVCRWDAERPADVDNLVLMTFNEAEAHEAASLAEIRRDQPSLAIYVDRQLQRACLAFDCSRVSS